ncbi:hypothetical protein FOL47_006424 [Perkinsus chesapeaki]|uniref:Stress-response A/B barrel domain-containing protein n=1 Tax=Perkinsus chesapeaki TaxID=330153 RepID=A0A7J6LSQ9_PERCH|nr:hypothetical protein FOL47_006424 [Perkinsus chesapeaki]
MPSITHMVSFKLKKGLSEPVIKELTEQCLSMNNSIPAVGNLKVKFDLGLDPERNQDFMLIVKFNDIDAYKNYSTNPIHLGIIENYIKPAIVPGTRVAMQFEDDA